MVKKSNRKNLNDLKPENTMTTMAIKKSTLNKVKRLAKERETSASSIMRLAIVEYLQKQS